MPRVLTDEEIAAIKADLVMLHGRDDQPLPGRADHARWSPRIPGADVHLFGRCGHNLPRERYGRFPGAAGACSALSLNESDAAVFSVSS